REKKQRINAGRHCKWRSGNTVGKYFASYPAQSTTNKYPPAQEKLADASAQPTAEAYALFQEASVSKKRDEYPMLLSSSDKLSKANTVTPSKLVSNTFQYTK